MSDEKNTAIMAKAFVGVQSEVLRATKDATNPQFHSRYARLDSVLECVREPLTKHGFALIQDATTDTERVTASVTTRLLHDSGGEIASQPLSVQLRKEYAKNGTELPPSVQQVGLAVTYLRRYSLCSFLGIALEDDDDGNAASAAGKDAPPAPPPAPQAGQPAVGSTRKSAHTGETLNTPAAVDRHKQAATQQAATQQPADSRPRQQPGGLPRPLTEALDAHRVSAEDLAGYLQGIFGEPRITKPILGKGMGLDTLGERIVAAMLKPENWKPVVDRIKADPGYIPF